MCNICGAKIKRGSSKSKSYTTSSIHEHLKTQHSESYKKSQSESLDKDRSNAFEPPKSMKLWDIKDSKAIKVYTKLLKNIDSDSDSNSAESKFQNWDSDLNSIES